MFKSHGMTLSHAMDSYKIGLTKLRIAKLSMIGNDTFFSNNKIKSLFLLMIKYTLLNRLSHEKVVFASDFSF